MAESLDSLGERMEEVLTRCRIPHHDELHGLIITEEAGEVARAILKRMQGVRGTEEFWSLELKKELAGVILATVACAAHHGISLDGIVQMQLEALEETDAESWRVKRPPNGN